MRFLIRRVVDVLKKAFCYIISFFIYSIFSTQKSETLSSLSLFDLEDLCVDDFGIIYQCPTQMKSQYFIDEVVLAEVLKNDATEVAKETAYTHYRKPFVQYFKEQYRLSNKSSRRLYQTAFSRFIKDIRKEINSSLFKETLFRKLLINGAEVLGEIIKNIPSKKEESDFLSGEILIQLIQRGNEAVFVELIKKYEKPIYTILKNKFWYSHENPMEIYGETMMILKKNIEERKVKLPMRARLFTYSVRIAFNKYRRFHQREEEHLFIPERLRIEEVLKKILLRDEECGYVKYITMLWPSLSILLEEQDTAFKGLIKNIPPGFQKVLMMRFEENMKYKEIAKELRIKENTARKQVFDALKYWRRMYSKYDGYKSVQADCLIK